MTRVKAGAQPHAIVMNMFYTGLGIARSLGERGVRVIGLTAKRRIYGNFTRYAEVRFAPDSRTEPQALLAFLLRMGRELESRAVIFPTRDDDLVFLDHCRAELEPYFTIVAPEKDVLRRSLNKWETYAAAREAGVPVPACWLIESAGDLEGASREARFPCVLKPLAAHHWRRGRNWDLVGARKAIAVASEQELVAEYRVIAQADNRALLQELVPGDDDCLVIVACYLDRHSRWVAGFNTQKLLQIPAGFGTGCIVQSVARPELFESAHRLLQSMRYSGIAEVEYKWDARDGDYKLIEINPRAWDQHRLGNAAAVDLIYTAYCERGGLPLPPSSKPGVGHKWVAEDMFATAVIRSLWRGTPHIPTMFRLAKGKRIYAIWSAKDPLPALAFWTIAFIPELITALFRVGWSAIEKRIFPKRRSQKEELAYETHVERPESLV